MPEITDEQLREWADDTEPDFWPEDRPMRLMAAQLLKLRQLVADFVDPDDCHFDHHGGCQAHGYLSLKPGELCPHAEAKQYLAEVSGDA
ncbi:hypothetical protein ACIBG0_38840 [Nocardia sp. NPDC050630]|uniref:hypothetical protein n=1 Tax=Nocardia sp. NPDC050630 TaxID=3364321 RepID=UPI00378DEBF7